jgi:hypothetical protein
MICARDLFEVADVRLPYNGEPPSQAHSTTSRAAGASIKKHIGPMHKRVLAYLNERPDHGATDDEMIEALVMGGNTLRPRRRELELMERLWNSGRTRPTTSGRAAVVWTIKKPEESEKT